MPKYRATVEIEAKSPSDAQEALGYLLSAISHKAPPYAITRVSAVENVSSGYDVVTIADQSGSFVGPSRSRAEAQKRCDRLNTIAGSELYEVKEVEL